MRFVEWSKDVEMPEPYDWQREIAESRDCSSRLIHIPTGFGKTLGVLSAWLWNRIIRNDDSWPRRLVWCLPMRVLVEQTESEVRRVLEQLSLLWNGRERHQGKVGVYFLMGGSDSGDWHLYPEECAVLIGTQDMLLSRSLNRGYGLARARWPMDFGLLNQDALWVMDEVQLMDVGLATSAQLQAFRHADAQKPDGYGALRPCHTWWMSATLQKSWLESVDTQSMLQALPPVTTIAESQRQGGLWEVRKAFQLEVIGEDKEQKTTAEKVWEQHAKAAGLTLVILNTVDAATKLFAELQNKNSSHAVDLRLVHSRFRPAERKSWCADFLHRNAEMPAAGRIIVATQVVEAGVDISACTLFTDLAPWPSLVQRFGRCARYTGETGAIFVLDRGWSETDEKKALPYEISQLLESKRNLNELRDLSPHSLEKYEDSLKAEERSKLYPYKPRHLLLQREWNELFDTSPDLSGADLDISRFIRSGEENDCLVFWREIAESGPSDEWKPLREELCAVPFLKAREWLGVPKTSQIRAITRKGKKSPVAWVWDWLEACWKKRTEQRDLLPGTVVLVDADFGGYSVTTGWNPKEKADSSFCQGSSADPDLQEQSDAGEEREDLSTTAWHSLSDHLRDVSQETQEILTGISPVTLSGQAWNLMRRRVISAGLLHDIGKAAEFFQSSIDREFASPPIPAELHGSLLAKAPRGAWSKNRLYKNSSGERRQGFRHELASALALFDILRQNQPEHCGLLGESLDFFSAQDFSSTWDEARPKEIKESQLLAELLDASLYFTRWHFDLVVYLVASHHGKVRCSLQASPLDQNFRDQDGRGMPVRGVREGDVLPEIKDANGSVFAPSTQLTLEPCKLGLSPITGPSWTERVQGLLEQFGPGALAYLEAILRAADIRASRTPGKSVETGE